MLTRVQNKEAGGPASPEVRIGDAAYPAIFSHALEFNPPAHGTWNIVHIGMKVPQSRQIYICALNCMRGVILTAAEMGEQERFSFVILKEEDLVEGIVDEITLEGITDILKRLPQLPPAVIVFPVCTHHFLGSNLKQIYTRLKQRFPKVDFIQGMMDPIMQKEGLTPDQKLRIHMYDVLRDQPEEAGTIAILGGNVSLAASSDLMTIAGHYGRKLIQMPDCETYEEYLALGRAEWMIGVVPNSRLTVQKCAARLGRKQRYLPMSLDPEEIEQLLTDFQQAILDRNQSGALCSNVEPGGMCGEDPWFRTFVEERKREAAEKLSALAQELKGVTVRIDYTAHPRPLGLARLLLTHGILVDRIYLNAVSGEEKADFQWLVEHAPDLRLTATIQPECRVLPRDAAASKPILAIGQQAAWFSGTDRFVNMVEGGDLYGFDGIIRLTDLMRDALKQPKDTRDLIPRKGLGCRSCL